VVLDSGSQFADYEIVRVAGKGAMATTYRAVRRSDQLTVALKVPTSRCLNDSTFVRRFIQEGKLGLKLSSPFIVDFYEVGEEQGRPFIAMEYLQGMTLKEGLAASGRVALRRALGLTRDIVEALEHAHGRGVVHRDLKPDNVMMRVGKCLKVMDFGIAKVQNEIGLTASNVFIGTPYYAAPEMIDSRAVGHHADLYSLGIMLYEMLLGEVPFTGTSPLAILLSHQSTPLPSHESLKHPVPREVYRLIEQLTQKKPEERMPDARSVRLALEMLLAKHSQGNERHAPQVIKINEDD
jgi:serine/threonine-protein kinase